MAHECPECGMKCHCNGDIDDMVLPSPKDESACVCCCCSACGGTSDECDCYDYGEVKALQGSPTICEQHKFASWLRACPYCEEETK